MLQDLKLFNAMCLSRQCIFNNTNKKEVWSVEYGLVLNPILGLFWYTKHSPSLLIAAYYFSDKY